LFEEFLSIHAGHPQVRDDQRAQLPLQYFEGILAVRGDAHAIAGPLEQGPHGQQDIFFVIDDQNADLLSHVFSPVSVPGILTAGRSEVAP
jgi:hypothetical protein